VSEIFGVQNFYAGEVFLKLGFDRGGKQGDAILIALAVTDDDLVQFKVDIFDAEPQTFEQPKAGAVKDLGQQLVCAGQGGDNAAGFVAGHNQRDALGTWSTDETGEFAEFQVKHFVIKKDEGVQRLILRGRRDLLVD